MTMTAMSSPRTITFSSRRNAPSPASVLSAAGLFRARLAVLSEQAASPRGFSLRRFRAAATNASFAADPSGAPCLTAVSRVNPTRPFRSRIPRHAQRSHGETDGASTSAAANALRFPAAFHSADVFSLAVLSNAAHMPSRSLMSFSDCMAAESVRLLSESNRHTAPLPCHTRALSRSVHSPDRFLSHDRNPLPAAVDRSPIKRQRKKRPVAEKRRITRPCSGFQRE